MAKAKYSKNSRGEYETKIWDGTYNADGSKHRKRLVSKKLIIPELSEPPVRTLGATIPENESHIFR